MYPKSIKMTLLVAATLALGLTASIAGEIKAGDLIIENPVARETAPGAPVAGGFLIIKNTGTSPDRLTGGSGFLWFGRWAVRTQARPRTLCPLFHQPPRYRRRSGAGAVPVEP